MNEQLWWHVSRATGVVAWGLLAISVLWGLFVSARLVKKKGVLAWSTEVHRFAAGMERAIVILIAAMPSAVTAVIFATDTGLDEDLVTSIVALSICVGVALLPWLPQLVFLLAG